MSHVTTRYKLVGTEVSLFTGKLRAYLRWKGISYETVLSSDAVYREVIKPYAHIQSIPVLLILECDSKGEATNMKVIQDTKDIMAYFEAAFPATSDVKTSIVGKTLTHAILPSTPKRAFAASVLELLADEWLLLQAMYWRWGDGVHEVPAFDAQLSFLEYDFGRTSTSADPTASTKKIQEVGRTRLQRFKGSLPGLGITPDTSPALREQFDRLLAAMGTHFEQQPFLLGKTITLADFAWYGPFYAHLGRDPIPSAMVKIRAPRVWEWIERVGGLGRNYGLGVERWARGSLIDEYAEGVKDQRNDGHSVPDTLNAVISFLLKDYLRVLRQTVRTAKTYVSERWQSTSSMSSKLPRALGYCDILLSKMDGSESKGRKLTSTHSLWTLQRILDNTCSTHAQQQAAHDWLEAVGGSDLSSLWRELSSEWRDSGYHITREDNQLVVVARKPMSTKL